MTISVAGRPLVVCAFAFVLGVAVGPEAGPMLLAFGGLLSSGGIAAMLGWRGRATAWLCVPVVFFWSGVVAERLDPPPHTSLRLPQTAKLEGVIEAWVRSVPEAYPQGLSYMVDLSGFSKGPVPRQLRAARGRVRLRIAGDGHSGGAPCANPGDRIRAFVRLWRPPPARFPGDRSARDWAIGRGYALEALAPGPAYCVVVVSKERSSWLAWFSRARAAVHAEIDAALAPSRAGVVKALTTGNRTGLREDDRDVLRDAGLAHLIAVSGFHLGVVTWVWLTGFDALFRRWPRIVEDVGAQRAAAACALPVVLIYTLFVGAPASAVRAGCMLGMVLVSRLIHRGRETWSALAAALLGMLAFDPSSLRDPGLQLSFAAVAGLVALPASFESILRIHPHRWARGFRFLWGSIAATLAATLTTAPFVAMHFGRISVVGLVTNIPASLLAGCAVPLALLGSVLSVLGVESGRWALVASGWASAWMLDLARFSAAAPWAALDVPRLTPGQALLVIVLGLAGWGQFGRRARRIALLAAVLYGVTAFGQPLRRFSHPESRITFLPVGQGDGAVVELPHGRVAVIDAGPAGENWDAALSVLEPFLEHRGIDEIDLFVATHPHADHIGGFPALAQRVPIREVWWSGDRREGPEDALDALAEHAENPMRPGLRLISGPASLEVLAPRGPPDAYPSPNDASIVVQFRHGTTRVLFTGDIEADGEARLVESISVRRLRTTILKAPHHGSRSSSGARLLEAAAPEHIVIPCGRYNRFGFPHREALVRMNETTARIWRTDLHGAVTVITDGSKYTVDGYLPEGG